MGQIVEIDDQPIAATFFGAGKWLTDFIEPDAIEVKALCEELTKGLSDPVQMAEACWWWVANKVKYVPFVHGKIEIHGKISIERDYWAPPSFTIHTRIGNCAVKSFLLTSLLRNFISSEDVYCVLGNLYDNGDAGGHAWVQVQFDSVPYVMEATTPVVPPMVRADIADRYEPVHFFNDKNVYAVQGMTALKPFRAFYSEWLRDYLDWAYIEGNK